MRARLQCGVMFKPNTSQVRCCPCRVAAEPLRLRATSAVGKAVRRGDLTNLKAEVVACTDCGARADRYDHRDYTKPLDVQPVCRVCNYKRGPAITGAAA